MAVTTKRKTSVKKEVVSTRYERLRLREWMIFWILVLANIALVCAIFGNVDVRTLKPVGVVNEEQKTAEQELVAALRAEVMSLQASLDTAKVEATTPTSSCSNLEVTPIDNYLVYTDTNTGVRMSIPYGSDWNTDRCPVTPADWNDGGFLAFGPLTSVTFPSGSDVAKRDANLTILPQVRSVAEQRELLRNPQEGDIEDLRERTISGIPVFSYTLEYVGPSQKYWVALGRTYTYYLSSYGWLTDAEAVKIIQSLRVTN
jgi:hypothetical protein